MLCEGSETYLHMLMSLDRESNTWEVKNDEYQWWVRRWVGEAQRMYASMRMRVSVAIAAVVVVYEKNLPAEPKGVTKYDIDQN